MRKATLLTRAQSSSLEVHVASRVFVEGCFRVFNTSWISGINRAERQDL